MTIKSTLSLLAITTFIAACNNGGDNSSGQKDATQTTTTMNSYEKGSFGYDLNFLQSKDSGLIVLRSPYDSSQIIISPKYQAKVFTSTADGMGGQSFGWVNYKAFDGPPDPHMNGYGGEDRLWLGPEGGKFSLFFKPGVKQAFNDWHTPASFDSEPWKLVGHDSNEVAMEKDMQLQNYGGTQLTMKVQRLVELLNKESIAKQLNVDVDKVKAVAFQTINSITNTGTNAWTETTGAPCTWNLDMFAPSEKCTIVIPYIKEASGKVATTDYFGQIPSDRIKWANGILFFKADGKSRGKMGIPPARVKNVAGSYDATNNVLTITKFDIKNNGKYLNQEWRTDRDPYSGDAMNAYNDGPLEDGSQMGPFYEIESVSPTAFLKSGEKLTHQHNVYHFTGDKALLNEIAKKVLGVSLEEIEKAF